MDGRLFLGCLGEVADAMADDAVCLSMWLRGSVLTQFNLERLPGFEWSQQEAEMAELAACAASNSTNCEVGGGQAGLATYPPASHSQPL